MSMKERVSGKVKFSHYQNGELWYVCGFDNFAFPVPIAETDQAKFLAEDKALLFMKWISRHEKMLNMLSKTDLG